MRSAGLALITSAFCFPSADASSPGKVNYCASEGVNYYDEDRFINDLRGVSWNNDVFDHDLKVYALAHCGSKRAVVVRPGPDRQNVFDARRIMVEMIANEKRETFQDVVDRLARSGYEASIDEIGANSCICAGDQ